MKKQYINYLLVILVLSLCILFYFRDAEGFQTSPVDFTNYTGQLTGLRIKITANTNDDPTVVFQQLLGNNISASDVMIMFERCNGDSVVPYSDTGIMGSSNEVRDMIWPEAYQALTSPAVMTAMLSNDQAAMKNAMASALPVYNMNFTRISRLPPVNLTNQNIQTVFNNIYGNLQRNGVILQSVILDNTNEYPKKICANQQALALTPKISVNANTVLTGLTIQTNFAMISQIFEFKRIFANAQMAGSVPSAVSFPTITAVDETGNRLPIDVLALSIAANEIIVAASQGGSISPARNEVMAVRTYTISNIAPMTIQRIALKTMFFSQAAIYRPEYSSYFYSGTSYFPDSVIQAYYTQLFIGYNGYMSMMSSSIAGTLNQSSSKPVFNILSYHLSNPEQDITLGTEAAAAGGAGGGASSSNTSTNSGSAASLLQSLRNLLCV